MKKFYVFCVLVCLMSLSSFAQPAGLFSYKGIMKGSKQEMIQRAVKIQLNRSVLESLYHSQPEKIELEIPLEQGSVIMELSKAKLFSQNAEVILADNLKTFAYEPGYYLQGKVKGENSSLAAISIFKDHIAGVLSFAGDNYNLCIANTNNDFSTDDYILYAEKDCTYPRGQCFTPESPVPVQMPSQILHREPNRALGCPVDIYFEAAYNMYTTLGSNPQSVMNYLTTLFNVEQQIYLNENLLIQLREVKIWNLADPEDALTITADVLNSFRSRIGASGFNGDLAHYVTTALLGGGRAALNAFCNTPGGRTGCSGNMRVNYPAYPAYSFTLNVIAHEIGHNFGSPHTHSCTWPGGAIDNCYATEGGCPAGPQPTNGGTIMSYCHTNFTIGINLANGFGPLPGDLIRTKTVDASTAGCICNCNNIKLDVTTQDIGCGNPLGTATAVVTDGTGPFTYEWSNGQTTQTATGFAAGTHYVKVTGSTPNCTVIKGFKIINLGNALSTTLSPAVTTVNRCPGETYPLTATVSPAGAYTFQWYKDAAPIPGATASSYTASSTGAYYLAVTSATCIGQSATVNMTFQPIPVPAIAVNGSNIICSNDSVRLSVTGTGYNIEWQRNGTAIPGATAADYFASVAGSYTVKLTSTTTATCFAVSVPVSITVKPAPAAAVTPAGAISFCSGGQAVITQSPVVTGETYAWFRNGSPVVGATGSNITVTNSGNYHIQVTGVNGCISKSEIKQVTVNPLPAVGLSPAGQVTLCDGGTLSIQATSDPAYSYQWYNGAQALSGQTAAQITVSGSGHYAVEISNSVTGCRKSSDTTMVTIIPPPRITAGHDTIIATGQQITLHAHEISSLGIDHYEWSPVTGLNNPNIQNPSTILYATQQYVVTGIHPSGCRTTDTVMIKVFKGPAFYVPSAFSPNGDGLNDYLHVIAVGMKQFGFFEVYNRLGQKVFRTTDLNAAWNGNWKGQPLSPGTYVWFAEGVDFRGKPMISKGSITIVR